MDPVSPDRRRFLMQLGCGVGLLAGARAVLGGRAASAEGPSPVRAFAPDVEVALRAAPAEAAILPGDPTGVWSLQGTVVRGGRGVLEDSGTPALGPTFRVHVGQRLRVTLDNGLAQETILHWHGLRVPAAADGHPRSAIPPGGCYVYEFVVNGPPGTYWYHALAHHRTGEQVYRGLAGFFIVEDERERYLGLPAGPFDLALALQDRSFDSGNQLVYLAGPAERMRGFLGDRILVNGRSDRVTRVAATAYRLRLLNASNSRIYRVAWSDGAPLVVIGTDGGLLDAPASVPYAMLAPGERIEVWADFGDASVGSERTLVSLPLGGITVIAPLGPGRVALGQALTLWTGKVDRASSQRWRLPARLATTERLRLADAINARAPRRVQATVQAMAFGFNGRTFDMDAVAADEHVRLGTLEAWEYDNGSAGADMGWMGRVGHPFHVHGAQFQVIRREGVAHSGYVDAGWKDTVLVMPGEKALMLMRFVDYPGVYVYHCQNLEHEDAGMMRNFSIDA